MYLAGHGQVNDGTTRSPDVGGLDHWDLGYGVGSTDDELDALAVRAGSGDRHAVDELLRRISGPVIRSCRARMSGRAVGGQTPDDVAQEVMIAVCSALGRYRVGETHWMAFVHGIARNKVNDAFRAAQRDRSDSVDDVPDSIDDDEFGPEQSALRQVNRQLVAELLAELNDQQREVLVLRIALGHSAEETAHMIGSTPGAVRVSQHRALNRLRALLDGRRAEVE